MDIQFKARLAIAIQLLSAFVQFQSSNGQNDCNYSAIFNFGDSNSDTVGNFIPQVHCPIACCKTWMPSHRKCLRISDGHLIIDFIAEKLGWPYLPGYAQDPRYEEDYSHGVNFAVAGAVVGNALKEQLGKFLNFTQGKVPLKNKTHLPPPDVYSKALYTIDIGHNDVVAIELDRVDKSVLNYTQIGIARSQYVKLVQNIYESGGRTFWVHNVGPLGCLAPFADKGPLDDAGCNKALNDVVQLFNKNVKEMLHNLQQSYKDLSVVYVDIYTAKHSLFQNATKLGFKDPFTPCIDKDKCSNPKESILFDKFHFTEAANEIVARNIMDGYYCDPPLPITKACNLPVASKTEL